MGHFSTDGQNKLQTKNFIFSLKMTKMHLGYSFRIFVAKNSLLGLISGVNIAFRDTFLSHVGYLYDVVSPRMKSMF